MPSLIPTVASVLHAEGVDLERLGIAWGRLLPSIALVPAFGLRALPAPARAVFGLALALAITPTVTLGSPPLASPTLPWAVLFLGAMVEGLPIAIATAVPLWAATMTGGVVDALRGSQDSLSLPTVEGKVTPLGVPLSLFVCCIFLSLGGPAHLAELAAHPPATTLAQITATLSGGITLAVLIATPFLVGSVLLETLLAMVARAATPAQIYPVASQLRGLGMLVLFALLFDRLAHVLGSIVVR